MPQSLKTISDSQIMARFSNPCDRLVTALLTPVASDVAFSWLPVHISKGEEHGSFKIESEVERLSSIPDRCKEDPAVWADTKEGIDGIVSEQWWIDSRREGEVERFLSATDRLIDDPRM